MAADINKAILVGRLTRDAELSYTPSGYPLCKFSVAVNRKKKQGDEWVDEVSFFDVTSWGKRGEAISQYLTKGKQVGIDGALRQDRWEDKNDGSKRSKVYIDAGNIQLLGGKSEGARPAPQADPAARQPGASSASNNVAGAPNAANFTDDVPF